MRKKGVKRTVLLAASAIFWLGLWQLAAMVKGIPLILPSPADTAAALYVLAGTGEFWLALAATVGRIFCGFAAGMITGTVLGWLTAVSPFADILMSPVKGVVKATPVTSIILLVILWVSASVTPIFISFLMVTPIFWANVQEGVLKTDGELLEMGRSFGFGARKLMRHITVPSVAPYFRSAVVTGLGIAWKSGVAAEVLSATSLSIGGNLYNSKIYLETENLFAWTAALIILSIIMERAIVAAVGRIARDKA